MFERTDDIFPCWLIWSLRPRGYGVCSRFIQLSSAESPAFFHIIFRIPGLFGQNFNGSCKNKTNHPISSNSHPSATANKAIHCLKLVGHKKTPQTNIFYAMIIFNEGII